LIITFNGVPKVVAKFVETIEMHKRAISDTSMEFLKLTKLIDFINESTLI
jgi:hypothetical protein